ncbi:MAG: ATPase, T2SS/T4P/T4SS family, partial [Candidatus Competibacter sp.]|nr:ATPase, T2SS/T4P/T4SS family [Candidatus Competibacter sp.]
DPIKFFHQHKQGVVLQREVGTDTDSYEIAINNALLQTPTVIMIDEVRDQKTMQYAIKFAETGLCMTTLQASNTEQAFDRIVNFFPKEKQDQVFMDLSVNVKAFVSLRLLPREDKPGLIPAVELMLKTPLIAELISRGRVKELKSAVLRANEQGIITFDQALFNLHEEGRISYETAIRYADAASNLRLRIGQESQRYRSKPLRESSEFEIKDKTRRVKPP